MQDAKVLTFFISSDENLANLFILLACGYEISDSSNTLVNNIKNKAAEK